MSIKYIRYVLYALLVVLAMMLWDAWVKDHPAPATPEKPIISSVTTEVSDAHNIPQPADQSTEKYDYHQNVNHQVATVVGQKFGKIPEERVIHVTTDVLDIDIDRLGGNIIRSELLKYSRTLKDKRPMIILNENLHKLYVAQSGISVPHEAEHTPLLMSSLKDKYQLENNANQLIIELKAKDKTGVDITKTFILKRGSYAIDVRYNLTNTSKKLWIGSYYMQLKHNIPPPPQGIAARILGGSSLAYGSGIAVSSPEKPYTKISFSKLTDESIHQVTEGGWIAILQHYFISAWVPEAKTKYRYYGWASASGVVTVGLIGSKLEIPPGKSIQVGSSFYVGPKIAKLLNQLSPRLWQTIDFGWLWFISIIIFKVLQFINRFVGNWGWSIVFLTILMKLAFYHLSVTTYRSMAAMKKLQPKVTKIREQYASDSQAMNRAMMDLYRKEKVNPLGGCLPTLVQIPVFIALYYVLLESVELRQAPFIFWIHDLSVKDPYYVLPILMGISMYIQQKLNPQAADPMQAKMFMLLPLLMTVFFLNFQSGLVLYWLVNNIISVAQQWYITKQYNAGKYDKKKTLGQWLRKK